MISHLVLEHPSLKRKCGLPTVILYFALQLTKRDISGKYVFHPTDLFSPAYSSMAYNADE